MIVGGDFVSGPVVSNMKLGWDRGKGRWFMSGILPIGPAKKTGSISDSEIDPVCYNGILWHAYRAKDRLPAENTAWDEGFSAENTKTPALLRKAALFFHPSKDGCQWETRQSLNTLA